MGTDGINLYYNPCFVKTLTAQELNFVIIHEVMHCALRHIWRRNNRVHNTWNIACDYAIHSIIKNECSKNIISMPNSALYNPHYNDMSAEEIYETLPKRDENNSGTIDNHDYWDNSKNSTNSSIEQQWEMDVINAANTVMNDNKNKGNVPGYFKRYIEKLTNPVKDWKVLLREFIEPEPNDYTFMRPDYRFDYDIFNCFLPSFNDEVDKVKKITFWIDTSGSISNNELSKIYSEVAGAVQQFDVFEGYLGFFDSISYEPKLFTDINSLKEIKAQGGGGTNFNAPFEYINEHKNFSDTKCIIILTDGYCDFPLESITNIPTIWLITTEDIKAPWGRSIYLPLKSLR
jgi:predicted metal-dependent peptidase